MTIRLVSAVVGWEISITYGLGRLELPAPPSQWVPDKLEEGAMTPISIELSQVLAAEALARYDVELIGVEGRAR